MENLTDLPLRKRLWLLFYHFFKIALFVVGGGYAIILAAEEIFVRKLRWLKEGELMEMIAVIQAVPGLMAGNAAVYVGFRAAGQLGALAALVAVALPSYIVICIVSVFYDSIPMHNVWVNGAFIGVRTALTGLTIVATVRIWPKSITGIWSAAAAFLTVVLILFKDVNPGLLIVIGAGVGIGSALHKNASRKQREAGEATLFAMFLLFLYFGCLCIGGGGALMPLYVQELVDARCWLTLQELGDFAALSQVTPGPIGVNLATFLGFRQGGAWGALVCTFGLLLPSYILMQVAVHSLQKWEKSPVVKGFLAGSAPVVVGLMAATTIIYFGLSIFAAPIPWEYLLDILSGRLHAYEGGFRPVWGAWPIFALSIYMFAKNKCSIMTAIFSSALLGALLCR